MPRFQSDSDARRLGEALAALRRDLGLSQAEAGARAGMTSQGWGLYEAGKRPGLFRPDIQRRLTEALGATPETLALKLEAPGAPPVARASGMEARDRRFDGAPVGETRRLQLSTDELAPWASSGVIIEYQPGRWPRRDQGCVVERVDGDVSVRIYDGADAESVSLRGVGPDSAVRLDRRDIHSLSAVIARIDP